MNSTKQSSAVTSKNNSFERLLNAPCVNLNLLRSLSRHGIPVLYRKTCWQLLLGYLPADINWRESHIAEKRREYSTAVKQQYSSIVEAKYSDEVNDFRQVLLDVPRTKPELSLFSDVRVQICLERILCIWTVGNQDLCYVQGINDLVTPFFAVFLSSYYEGIDMVNMENIDDVPDNILKEVEADTYWCLDIFLSCLRDHYTPDLPGQRRMVNLLERKMQNINKPLCKVLKGAGLDFNLFAFKWMNNLLVREFPINCVMRLWDTYLSEENLDFEEIHVNVCAGFLQEFSPVLKRMEFDQLFESIQRLPAKEWGDSEVELLLSQASLWLLMDEDKSEVEELEVIECDEKPQPSSLESIPKYLYNASLWFMDKDTEEQKQEGKAEESVEKTPFSSQEDIQTYNLHSAMYDADNFLFL